MMIWRRATTVPQQTEAVRTRMTRVSTKTSRRNPSRKLVRSSTLTTTAAPAAMLRWRTLTGTAMRTAMAGTSRLWNGPRRSRRCLNDGNVLSHSKTRSRQDAGKPGAGSKGGEGRRGAHACESHRTFDAAHGRSWLLLVVELVDRFGLRKGEGRSPVLVIGRRLSSVAETWRDDRMPSL
jgi:hypothetical protein